MSWGSGNGAVGEGRQRRPAQPCGGGSLRGIGSQGSFCYKQGTSRTEDHLYAAGPFPLTPTFIYTTVYLCCLPFIVLLTYKPMIPLLSYLLYMVKSSVTFLEFCVFTHMVSLPADLSEVLSEILKSSLYKRLWCEFIGKVNSPTFWWPDNSLLFSLCISRRYFWWEWNFGSASGFVCDFVVFSV